MVDQEIIDLPDDSLLSFDSSFYLPLEKALGDSRRRTLNSLIAGFQTPWLQNINADNKNIISLGTLNTHTIPGGTDTLALLAATQTLTNKTLTAPAIADFTNATHAHFDAMEGGILNAILALDATGTKDSTTFLRGDNTWDVPPGTETPFTWAASDEDSPLPPILTALYTTEGADKDRTITKITGTLKNAPTGSFIGIIIERETGLNTNTFEPVGDFEIDVGDFTTTTAGTPPFIVAANSAWNEGIRLKFGIVSIDTNFAATGLKVTIVA